MRPNQLDITSSIVRTAICKGASITVTDTLDTLVKESTDVDQVLESIMDSMYVCLFLRDTKSNPIGYIYLDFDNPSGLVYDISNDEFVTSVIDEVLGN